MDKKIKKLADDISFRLLATRNHPEYKWLKKRLKQWISTYTEQN